MTYDRNDDDNTTTGVGTDPHITVLTCGVSKRGTTPYDGALLLTGWLSYDGTVYTYVWNNCDSTLETRLFLINRCPDEGYISDLGRSWVHDFIPRTPEDNLIQVAIDCMFNDLNTVLIRHDRLSWGNLALVWEEYKEVIGPYSDDGGLPL